MIPKIIHYCWFGGNSMPRYQKEFVDGWKAMMPDYEFKCWSEKNFDVDSFPFAKQAKDAGKFAFVADYCRIWALYHEGGIYVDTDVKIKSSLTPYTKNRVFTSYEFNTSRDEYQKMVDMLTADGDRKDVSVLAKVPGNGLFSALIGAEKGHPFIKDCLDFYNANSFESVFSQRFTIPTVLALNAEKYGLKYKNIEQHLCEDIMIYDTSVFSDYYNETSNSVAIHYSAGSWSNKSTYKKIKKRLYRISWLRKFILFLFPKDFGVKYE